MGYLFTAPLFSVRELCWLSQVMGSITERSAADQLAGYLLQRQQDSRLKRRGGGEPALQSLLSQQHSPKSVPCQLAAML